MHLNAGTMGIDAEECGESKGCFMSAGCSPMTDCNYFASYKKIGKCVFIIVWLFCNQTVCYFRWQGGDRTSCASGRIEREIRRDRTESSSSHGWFQLSFIFLYLVGKRYYNWVFLLHNYQLLLNWEWQLPYFCVWSPLIQVTFLFKEGPLTWKDWNNRTET